jgi:hypothetical protein
MTATPDTVVNKREPVEEPEARNRRPRRASRFCSIRF